jgi:hypothetical protein
MREMGKEYEKTETKDGKDKSTMMAELRVKRRNK